MTIPLRDDLFRQNNDSAGSREPFRLYSLARDLDLNAALDHVSATTGTGDVRLTFCPVAAGLATGSIVNLFENFLILGTGGALTCENALPSPPPVLRPS